MPHIIFNPDYYAHFPGPEYWNAHRSGKVQEGIATSGIGQPPVHASIAVRAAEPHFRRAGLMRNALNMKLCDASEALYYDYDLVSRKLIKRDTIFSYMPLFAGSPDQRMGKVLLEALLSHCFCVAERDCVAIPSYDMCQIDYEGEFYWRGLGEKDFSWTAALIIDLARVRLNPA